MKAERIRNICAKDVPDTDRHQRHLMHAIEAGLIDQPTLNRLKHYGLRVETSSFVKSPVMKAIRSGDLSTCVGIDPDFRPRKALSERANLASLRIQLARLEKVLSEGITYRGKPLTQGQTVRRMEAARFLREKIWKLDSIQTI